MGIQEYLGGLVSLGTILSIKRCENLSVASEYLLMVSGAPPAVKSGLSCDGLSPSGSGVPEGAEPVEERPQRKQEEAQILLQDGGRVEGQGQD